MFRLQVGPEKRHGREIEQRGETIPVKRIFLFIPELVEHEKIGAEAELVTFLPVADPRVFHFSAIHEQPDFGKPLAVGFRSGCDAEFHFRIIP